MDDFADIDLDLSDIDNTPSEDNSDKGNNEDNADQGDNSQDDSSNENEEDKSNEKEPDADDSKKKVNNQEKKEGKKEKPNLYKIPQFKQLLEKEKATKKALKEANEKLAKFTGGNSENQLDSKQKQIQPQEQQQNSEQMDKELESYFGGLPEHKFKDSYGQGAKAYQDLFSDFRKAFMKDLIGVRGREDKLANDRQQQVFAQRRQIAEEIRKDLNNDFLFSKFAGFADLILASNKNADLLKIYVAFLKKVQASQGGVSNQLNKANNQVNKDANKGVNKGKKIVNNNTTLIPTAADIRGNDFSELAHKFLKS